MQRLRCWGVMCGGSSGGRRQDEIRNQSFCPSHLGRRSSKPVLVTLHKPKWDPAGCLISAKGQLGNSNLLTCLLVALRTRCALRELGKGVALQSVIESGLIQKDAVKWWFCHCIVPSELSDRIYPHLITKEESRCSLQPSLAANQDCWLKTTHLIESRQVVAWGPGTRQEEAQQCQETPGSSVLIPGAQAHS